VRQETLSYQDIANILHPTTTQTNASKMAADLSHTRPVRITREARQETLTYRDVADILNLGSAISSCLQASPCSSDDIVPQKMDILCGRDKEAFGHVGNKRFRTLISVRRDSYQNAKANATKTGITQEIVASIRECGGRFLRKDKQTGVWHEVGDDCAHEKVSHALRGAKDPQKRCRKKKQNATDQSPVFQTLLAQQQQIFMALVLNERQPSGALDSEEEEQSCSISV
jgi:hypothetical protein